MVRWHCVFLACLLGSLFTGCQSLVPAPTTVALARFDSPGALEPWTVRPSDPPTVFEPASWPGRQEGTCLRMVFPPTERTGSRWPAAILAGEAIPIRDWRGFEAVELEIWSGFDEAAFKQESAEFYLHFRDTDHRRASCSKPDLRRGRQTLRLPLPREAIDWQHVDEVHFVMQDPEAMSEVWVNGLRLVPRDLLSLQGEMRRTWRKLRQDLPPDLFADLPPTMQDDWHQLGRTVDQALSLPLSLPGNGVAGAAAWSAAAAQLDHAKVVLETLRQRVPTLHFVAGSAGRPFAWNWALSTEKILRTRLESLPQARPVIELARNEAEAIQLAVMPMQDLSDVRVALVDAFVADSGGTIGPEHVSIAPVGYVKTAKPPYPVSSVGWWPDPILTDVAAVDLAAHAWQPFWVEVSAPADQPAGIYRGSIEITARGIPPTRVPLAVRVWDFALADGSVLPVAFAFINEQDARIPSVYFDDPEVSRGWTEAYRKRLSAQEIEDPRVRRCLEIRDQFAEIMFEHRLSPDRIYRADPPTPKQAIEWRRRGASRFCILHVGSLPSLKKGQPYPAERTKKILATLEKVIPEYEKAGVLDMAYIYCFDEVRGNQFAAMRDVLGQIKRRWPGIPIVTTARDMTFGVDSGLDEVIDVWTPLTPDYAARADARQAARERGRQVWWYVCCGPHPPYANFFIECSGTEHRLLPGLMAYKMDCEGFLYYGMATWRKYHRRADGSWDKSFRTQPMRGAPLTDWAARSYKGYNGDGNFIYPRPDGPVPSTRLKNLRDGLEDYMFASMLERALGTVERGEADMSRRWCRQAREALAVDPRIVSSPKEFTTDGALLLEARKQIAELLEEYARK